MKLIAMFLIHLIYPLAIAGFVFLTIKNHPFMAVFLLLVTFSTSFRMKLEDKNNDR